MTKTAAAIRTARLAAGKPWENDAYAAAQRALDAQLTSLMEHGWQATNAIASICAVHGVERTENGTWILD